LPAGIYGGREGADAGVGVETEDAKLTSIERPGHRTWSVIVEVEEQLTKLSASKDLEPTLEELESLRRRIDEIYDDYVEDDSSLRATRDGLRYRLLLAIGRVEKKLLQRELSSTLFSSDNVRVLWEERAFKIQRLATIAEAHFMMPPKVVFEDSKDGESDPKLIKDDESTNEPIHSYHVLLRYCLRELASIPPFVDSERRRQAADLVRGMLNGLQESVRLRCDSVMLRRSPSVDTGQWINFNLALCGDPDPRSEEPFRLPTLALLEVPYRSLEALSVGPRELNPKNPHSMLLYGCPTSTEIHTYLTTMEYLAEDFERHYRLNRWSEPDWRLCYLSLVNRARFAYAACARRIREGYKAHSETMNGLGFPS